MRFVYIHCRPQSTWMCMPSQDESYQYHAYSIKPGLGGLVRTSEDSTKNGSSTHSQGLWSWESFQPWGRRGYKMDSWEKHGMCQSVYKSPSNDTVPIYMLSHCCEWLSSETSNCHLWDSTCSCLLYLFLLDHSDWRSGEGHETFT